MNRGDVVVISFPYSDATGRKVRPALVVQSDALNAILDDTVLALITSRLHRILDTHVRIELATPEGQLSGLRLDSAVQCENLYTIDQRLIRKKIGALPMATMALVDEGLRKSLGL